ncbi:ankyrin repeat domain-containing protein 52 [Verticillium dahliae]
MDDRSTSAANFLHATTNAIAGTETRILIVSRFLAGFQHALKRGDRGTLSEYKLGPDDVQPDITAYSRDIVDRKLSNKNLVLRSSLSEAMATRCEGQFLWLRLQGESLRRGMSKRQLEEAVEETPTELDRVYDHNWKRITQLRDADRRRACALLRWAVFGLRPLAIEESDCDDLAVEDLCDTVDDDYIGSEILGLCGPLLEVKTDHSDVSPGRRTLHLPHFTVRQYILSNLPSPERISRNSLRASCEMLHHTLLAEVCLRFISLPSIWKQNSSFSPTIGTRFLHYAASSWHRHVLSGVGDEPTLMELAMRLFEKDNPCFIHWSNLVVRADTSAQEEAINPPGPLYHAVSLELSDLVVILVQSKKCDVNEGFERGMSPLVIASASGVVAVVSTLIEAGADTTVADNDGVTPVCAASDSGHTEVVKLLLENGADITVADTSAREWCGHHGRRQQWTDTGLKPAIPRLRNGPGTNWERTSPAAFWSRPRRYGPPATPGATPGPASRYRESSPKRGRPCLADRRRTAAATPARLPALCPLT